MTALGVFRSPSSRANVAEFEAWQGRPVDVAVGFHGRGTVPISKPGWLFDAHRGGVYRLNVRLALVPVGSTLEAVARGDHDDLFRAAGLVAVAAGRADTIWSVGWEPNMDGYLWRARGREPVYVQALKRAIAALRSTPGNAFEFSLCLLAGATRADVDKLYPGPGWLHWLGLDAYDNSPVHTSPEDRWQHLVDRPVGLGWQVTRAREWGLKLAWFECGSLIRTDQYANVSGGDNPYYWTRLFEWAQRHDVLICPFEDDESPPGPQHRLMPSSTLFPRSSVEYRRLVAALDDAPPPPPPPPPPDDTSELQRQLDEAVAALAAARVLLSERDTQLATLRAETAELLALLRARAVESVATIDSWTSS